MHLTDQRQCSPLGAVVPMRPYPRSEPPRTPEDDELTISAKDLELISEVIKGSRVVDSDDMAKFTQKIDVMNDRITSVHSDLQSIIKDHADLKTDMQGLLEAWRAGGALLGTAKMASKVVGAIAAFVLAIGVIGSIITHPELWFSKGS
jgi:hypothetical protein